MKREIKFSSGFKSRVARWAAGEITWAEVEGFTVEKAREYSKTACDLARRGQLKKAAAIFEGLVAMNPKDHSTRAALGTVYQKMGRLEDAMAAYEQALATDPNDVVALSNRGELRLKSGNVAGGLGDLSRAVEADPNITTASAARARALATAVISQAAKAAATR
jgi:Flp pilus assembly protein TadD